jgi:hypothetical protein
MRPIRRPILTVDVLPVAGDRHIGLIVYVLDARAFYAGYRDGAGVPQWAPVGVAGP